MTNDNYIVAILKWLISMMTIAITLPMLFKENSKIVFILTICIFIFSKLIDNVEGIEKYSIGFSWFFFAGIIIGIFGIMVCFYYFGAIFNEFNLSPGNVTNLELNDSLTKYPFFNNDAIYLIAFIILIFYVVEDLILGICLFCRLFVTKKIISRING